MPLPDIETLKELKRTRSFRTIGRMYGCHHSWVAYKMRGVDTSKPDLRQRNKEIISMYADSVPVNIIARKVNLSERSIYLICSGKVERKWTKKI